MKPKQKKIDTAYIETIIIVILLLGICFADNF